MRLQALSVNAVGELIGRGDGIWTLCAVPLRLVGAAPAPLAALAVRCRAGLASHARLVPSRDLQGAFVEQRTLHGGEINDERAQTIAGGVTRVDVELDDCLVVAASVVTGRVVADVLAGRIRSVRFSGSGEPLAETLVGSGPMCVIWPDSELTDAAGLVARLDGWSASGVRVSARSSFTPEGRITNVRAWAA